MKVARNVRIRSDVAVAQRIEVRTNEFAEAVDLEFADVVLEAAGFGEDRLVVERCRLPDGIAIGVPVAADDYFRQLGRSIVHKNGCRVGTCDCAEAAMAHVGEQDHHVAALVVAQVIHNIRKMNLRAVRARPIAFHNINQVIHIRLG